MYALFKYDLKKRQCMFSTLAMEMVWTKKDQLHIEIPIKVPEYQLADGSVSTSIPVEMMIARKRDLKAIYEQFTHLKNFVTPIQARNFTSKATGNNQLIVLGETDEAVNHILNSQLGDIFSDLADEHLIDLHISDQKSYNNYPLWFKATLYIPDPSN